MSRGTPTLAVFALVLAACGGGSTTTTVPSSTTAAGGGDASTTSTAPTTSTTSAQTTTTPAADTHAIVTQKTAAVEAALPVDWTSNTGPQDDLDEDDLVWGPCLLADDFDLDNLDAFSEATLVTNFEGPGGTPPFSAPQGSIEARILEDEAIAAEVFVVFERLFGTEEGLQCMTDVVLGLVGDEAPIDELTLSFEELTVAGSQAGARFEMSFDVSGFSSSVFVEFQGARMGSCTVIASFITFAEPFDRDIADTLFSAAVGA